MNKIQNDDPKSTLSFSLGKGTLAPLVVQWLRIHLAMLETPVQSLVQEDPIRYKATEPVHPNY